ncbi:phage baseplate assembly protein V [Crenobacter sp. SG2305]|uniref:phage baseplate assembly protein V n=1 Tax=Crenobacter oryzisoli TaxID=3056844 RepID=UPI0025AAFBBD|nr:phage baseplate assembly protein V [Crenobacter sp. SG2305]MDN0081611.1 phage baseplate assembly protein V [Crenobacter sp. SG2305]
MDQSADLSRRLESLIRTGTIADVQMKPPRVCVQSGQLTTDWLPWISLRAGRTRKWSPPTKGEQCIVFSPSGETAAGIVLVGIPSDLIPAPSDSPDEDVTDYPDGARVAYNHATGALSAIGIQTATIEAAVKVTVDCPKTEFTGDVDILGKLTVNGETLLKALLSYMAGMSGKGGSGKTVIEGNIEHRNGKLSSNGVVVDEHTHPEHDGPNTREPNK